MYYTCCLLSGGGGEGKSLATKPKIFIVRFNIMSPDEFLSLRAPPIPTPLDVDHVLATFIVLTLDVVLSPPVPRRASLRVVVPLRKLNGE